MSEAIALALASLVFNALNDIAFKRYASRDRSRGFLIFGVGMVWFLLQGAAMAVRGRAPAFDAATLGFGAAAGLVLAASNILLVECLARLDVSLASTIYRLNTLVVVLLSWLFLGEAVGPAKAAGIAAGIGAVLLLARRPGTGQAPGATALAIVIVAALVRAGYGVFTKAGLNQGADADTLMLLAALAWIAGGALYARFREGRFRPTRKKAAYAALSGTLVFLVVTFLVAAVARGEASVVIPIANLSFVAALLLSVALGLERLTGRKVAAVGLAAASVGLLAIP